MNALSPSVRRSVRRATAPWLAAATLLLVALPPGARAQLPEAAPESLGFSEEGLEALDAGLRAIVDDGKLAGISTLLARDGKLVHRDVYGLRDIESGAPMQADTIVRIYSMTKPVTGVAMMMLYEEGKWKPEDPIAKHIPEFEKLQVYAGEAEGGALALEEPGHAPTMGELMSHTAGFTYGFFGNSPVDRRYRESNPLAAESLQGMIDRLATLPLAYPPGEGWMYSVSVDIQGYLVERLSGQTFPEFLRTRIFEPLGMRDTAFRVPEEKLDRLATLYSWDRSEGALAAMPREPGVSQIPGLPSGGGGLYSTAGDYLRFAQLVANEGELDGVRLLQPETVRLMRANHVPDAVRQSGRFGVGAVRMNRGQGFGFDFAVIDDPAAIESPVGEGSFYWFGIGGTWFWIDPENDIVFVGLIQRRGGAPGAPDTQRLSRERVYEALRGGPEG